MPPIRTFLAVEVDAGVRSRAAALINRLSPAGERNVKWVRPDSIHLTLCFLGYVDILRLPDICRAAEEAAANHEPFEMELAGAGAFPTISRPRTIWVGVRHGKEELIALQRSLEGHLADLGFAPESRQFRPHLTLGRAKQAAQESKRLCEALQKEATTRLGGMAVSEVTIFSSRLDRGGAEYEALGHADLGMPAG